MNFQDFLLAFTYLSQLIALFQPIVEPFTRIRLLRIFDVAAMFRAFASYRIIVIALTQGPEIKILFYLFVQFFQVQGAIVRCSLVALFSSYVSSRFCSGHSCASNLHCFCHRCTPFSRSRRMEFRSVEPLETWVAQTHRVFDLPRKFQPRYVFHVPGHCAFMSLYQSTSHFCHATIRFDIKSKKGSRFPRRSVLVMAGLST